MYELITCRHSERKYADKTISSEDLQKIVDAGLSAPSGMNTQPWHFTVIQNKQVQREIVETCKKRFEEVGSDWRKNWAKLENFNPFYSPDVLVVVSRKSSVGNSNEDCCFAIENMVLMAESLGISSCIIRDICWGIDADNQERYGIAKDYECFMSVSFGFATNKNKNKKILDYSKVNFIK